MFLKRRVLQAEYFDSPDRTLTEVAEGYAMLARVNRLFLICEPFKTVLPSMLGEARCRSLSLLDLGAGDGSLGNELRLWANERGWDWRFTNLDLNPRALRLNPATPGVTGSALSLPFRDQSFDVVIASQMAHHLGREEEVGRHFKEAWRVARDLVFLNDLHRSIALYGILWLVLRICRFPDHFRSDGLLSVRRGWRVDEWRVLANQAGIPEARVWLYAGARVMLGARRRK